MPGDESLPGSDDSGSVNLGLGLHNLQEGESQIIADGQQRRAEAGNPPGPLLRPRNQAGASASAINSPQPAKPAADESEDVLFCFVWLATLGVPVVASGTAADTFRRVVEAP